jgi:hypothetical protein
MSIKSNQVGAAFLILILTTTGQMSAAILEGQTVSTLADAYDMRGQHLIFGGADAVVGPGVELPTFGNPSFLIIDFSDENILITSPIDQSSWGGPHMTLQFIDTNATIPRFMSATVNPATNWDGFGAESVFVAPNRISLAMPYKLGLAGQQISLDITAMVPEPATLVLASTGAFLGAGLSLRRRAKR